MGGALAPLLLLGGLVLLLFGGRSLVDGATAIAARLRIPPIIVGLTIVAWGTSAPELAFNAIATSKGEGDLVFGNVVGANICNLALILGITSLMAPIAVDSRLLRFELPVVAMLQSALLVTAIVRVGRVEGDAAFTRVDGLLLLTVFVVVMLVTARSVHRVGVDSAAGIEEVPARPDARNASRDVLRVVAGLVLLGAGGAIAADGAVGTARLLGIPESVVGLTIVSLGTTLPELVTGIIAARRGQVGLLMGNIIGSCLFNVGVIFAICTMIAPLPIPDGGIGALVVMTTVGLLMLPMSVTHSRRTARIEGIGLLLIYATFLAAQAMHAM